MPAQYSPIAPVHLLKQLDNVGALGPYLLLLAHDVLAHPKEYLELIESQLETHPNELFIIMDNGVIEKGAPVSLNNLLEAADLVEANVVVGPDIVGNLKGTKALMMEQADFIKEDYSLMFIPQGGNFAEIFDCIDWYTERFPEIAHSDAPSYWGIPRWVANELGSRHTIVNDIITYDEQAKIHLLGMSYNLRDDLATCLHPNVMGIDSANPLVLGHRGYRIYQDSEHYPRENFWDECLEVNADMLHNVRWVQGALNAGQ